MVQQDEEEIDLNLLAKFTYVYLRRFGLGCLRMTADQFGITRVGDFFDAMAGYNEERFERFKASAGLVRMATSYLVNVQLSEGDRMTPEKLWPFPWEKEEETAYMTREEHDEYIEKASKFFTNAGV